MFGVQVSVLQDAKQAESQPKSRGTGTRRELEEIGKVTQVWQQTESRADGTFFLLDCPDGHYTITALDAHSGIQSSKSISVAENAMKKRMKDRGTEEGYQIELVLKK